MTESELRDHFNQFGDVDYVSIVRDRATKESKGFAYIKYHRMSHAAKAFEDCDRTFKPVFADPKPQKSNYHESNGADRMNGPGSTTSASTTASVSAGYDMLSYMDTSHTNPDGNCRLTVIASSLINQDQLWRLFDLVPGLDFCELKYRDVRNNRAVGAAVYTNARSAQYARDKLHGFEYPPGERLIVKLDTGPASETWPPPPGPPLQYNMGGEAGVAQAMNNLQLNAPPAAPAAPSYIYDPAYCSIALPPPQPLSHPDCPVVERLFLVCSPAQPPVYVVKDVFCRFGGLIDLYFLNGKRCGYALFSNGEAALKALSTMNGQEICGVRLKVMKAEPRKIHENAIQNQPEQM